MTNFVVFNELCMPLSNQHWRGQLKSYIDVVKQLQDCGISTIRTEHHFAQLTRFTQTQSLAEFFGTLPQDMKTRLKSLLFNQTNTFQSPLVSNQEKEQHTELTINSEYYLDGKINTGGLACAHIWNTPAISFLTDDKWAAPSISLLKSHIEFDDEHVTVDHLSQLEHCQYHQQALTYSPQTVPELMQFCEFCSDQYPFEVQFTEQANVQLNTLIQQSEEHLERVYHLIKSIKQTPAEGIGKPELLKHNLAGSSSRRITQEHRIVYKQLSANTVEILYCLGHYQ